MLVNIVLNTLSKVTHAKHSRDMKAPMPGIRGCPAGITGGSIFSVCNQDFLLMCFENMLFSLFSVIHTGQNLLLAGQLFAATV